MKTLNQVLVCAFNAKGHVLTVGTHDLPYGGMLPEESQREAAVRILQEQTGFVIDQNNLQALMYDVIKGSTERHVLSYLCTKVIESDYQDDFQSTQAFLANCYDQTYNHNALMCASELSTQQRLPWTKTCYTKISNQPETETTLKELEMTNETTQPKTLILKDGGTYLTKEGQEVTLNVTPGCGEGYYHQFLGNNSYYYTKHGEVFHGQDHEENIVSEVQPEFLKEDLIIERRNTPRTTDTTQGVIEKIAQEQRKSELKEYNRGFVHGQSRSTPKETLSKFYTEQEVMSLMEQQGIVGWKQGYDEGLLASNSLSTSEIQSLITQQSKVIFQLECEISELKELQSYLGKRSYIQEVQDLRKAVFNKITTKQKRLGKLVALQIKLKRSK